MFDCVVRMRRSNVTENIGDGRTRGGIVAIVTVEAVMNVGAIVTVGLS